LHDVTRTFDTRGLGRWLKVVESSNGCRICIVWPPRLARSGTNCTGIELDPADLLVGSHRGCPQTVATTGKPYIARDHVRTYACCGTRQSWEVLLEAYSKHELMPVAIKMPYLVVTPTPVTLCCQTRNIVSAERVVHPSHT